MTHKVYVVTDLGPGDGGKGGVVHKIATMQRAHTILKRGGAQGSHGVRTSGGKTFAFSQWGCGTFEGILTHLTDQLVVSPVGLLNEAEALRTEGGIPNPWGLLTVDANAICATPFHGIASRLKELARGNNPRGTIGTGVGEAYRDAARVPGLIIRAGELSRPDLRDRLAAVRDSIRATLQPIIGGEFLEADRQLAAHELRHLHDDAFLDYVVRCFQLAGKLTQIVSPSYLGEVVLARPGVAVVETSHGVLTDRVLGFHPHTSALRTLPRYTHGLLARAGFTDHTVNLGVTRAYAIRHGAGPLPTADPAMAERLLPSSNKDANRWQGTVRVGPFDCVLLRYAVAACGGPAAFDGLAVTWFDQIQANQAWHVCNRYEGTAGSRFFSSSGDIRIPPYPLPDRQEALGRVLTSCRPIISTTPIDATADKDDLYDVCAGTVGEQVGVPVRMVSFGPTELDKLCK